MGTGGALGPRPAGWHPSATAKGVRGRGAAIVAAGAAALGEGGRALPAAAAEPVPPRSMPRGGGVRRSPLARFSPPEAGAGGPLGELGKAGGRRTGTMGLTDLAECEGRALGRVLCA